jgi:hypothetical protein
MFESIRKSEKAKVKDKKQREMIPKPPIHDRMYYYSKTHARYAFLLPDAMKPQSFLAEIYAKATMQVAFKGQDGISNAELLKKIGHLKGHHLITRLVQQKIM